ncbi:beta-N-acetylglucosaminidase domain-containing protein [Streptacidiphilus jiangxiensis]|uniref:Hyaluronoglucosaminidase n=1 Tax=Streptacidiphilus jiangxiensis TaxID=235985 RepID=A0A1H7S3Q5_STRJI|nr:beta-N-acetylglucosaminidase domain-containing protein [Streptacidiphilus jiangxiensis]SEL66896.1 hyaluronoglucosaminidase [Streptacidiphilus jiangxiensis]
MDHRPGQPSDGFVAALGSSLRRTVAEHQTLQQLLGSAAVVTARRTAARTARRLAPEAADRLIAQLKGTAPLLAVLPLQMRTQVGARSAALRASAALTVAAVVGGGLVGNTGTAVANAGARATAQVLAQGTALPPGGGDAASNSGPAIYPRPQREQAQGTAVAGPARVALAVAPHADPGALAVLQAALAAAGVQRVDTVAPDSDPQPGALTIYLGGAAEGAGGGTDRALRSLGAAGQTALSPSGLPAGGYVLATGTIGTTGSAPAGNTGVAVLAGVDAEGTYHAAQSFRQILGAGGALPGLAVQDWPAAPIRGVVEGFYGIPWSAAQTADMIDFLGQTKQNRLLYAPGDDPYRDTLWRDPYPADQQAELRTLAQRAALNHVTLGYSLSPATSLCYTSAKDQNALVAKLEQLWGLGVRSFQLDFSQATFSHWHCDADANAYGHGPQAAAQAQADVVGVVLRRFLSRHPGADGLTVLPSEYYRTDATAYRTALARELDGSVRIAWTGAGVEPATISAQDLTTAQQTLGHPLLTEDNYPVNDSAQDRLYLGAYQGRDATVATGAAGLLVNAMQQPVASRVPLFTSADFAWNPQAYQPDASWQAAVSALAGATGYGSTTYGTGSAPRLNGTTVTQARAALAALAGNSASSPLGQQESAYLQPLLAAFWAAFEPASPRSNAADPAATTARSRAAAQLGAAFTTMAQASDNLSDVAGGQLLTEDAAWIQELTQYGRAGQAAVAMLAAQRAGNGAEAWRQRSLLRRQLDQLSDSGVTLGKGVLDAFLNRALKASDSWTGVDGDQLTPTSSMGTAQDHDPALMVDGDPSSYYWTSAPPQAGDTVGVDLGSDTPVRSVHILMGGPDGDVAQGDVMQDAVLEYATDDGGWVQVGHYQGRSEIDATLPPGAVARYLRLRAASGQDSAVAVREFSVTAPDATAMTATGPTAVAGSPVSNVVDGDLDAPYQAAAAPQPGDTLSVTLGQTRPLNRVVVLTDPSVRAPGWVEVHSADNGWTRIGAIAPGGYTELAADPKLRVDQIRLFWAGTPDSQAPTVYQIIPWYADTPPATLQLGAQSVDLQAGGAAVALPGVLQAQGVGGATGTVTAKLPAAAKDVTVAGTGTVALPRGGSAGVPLRFAAAADSPTGSYVAQVTFTVGGRVATQDVTVHVYPRTGGPDLALTGTASSSADETSDFPASNVNDDDPTTRWSSPAQDDEWVQVQLAAPATLGEVVLHWQDAYAARYEIQTSTDGQNWTTAAVVNSGHGGDETVRFGAVTAQYVRMQGLSRATRFGYSLYGLEAYAVIPAPTPTPTPTPPSPTPTASTPPATPDPSPSATPSPTATP